MLELRMTIVASHTGAHVASVNPMPMERESVCCREIHQVENKLMDWHGSSIDCITKHGFSQCA